jgi:hypothetical protein
MVKRQFAIKGIWALCDSIYMTGHIITVAMVWLIRGATGSDEPWPAEQPPLAVFPDSCIFSFPNRTVTSLFK